jgi:hypothetical protein
MKKVIQITLLFLLVYQVSFAQNNDEIKYNEALEAYRQENYEVAVSKILEAKPLYRTVPPKVLYIEIMAKAEIIKINPFSDFALLDGTRKLAAKYLTDNSTRKNKYYNDIQNVTNELYTFPKDKVTFNALKESEERERAKIKLDKEKKEKQRKIKAEAERIKLETANAEAEKNRKEVAVIEAEKARLAKINAETNRVNLEKEQKIQNENERKYYDSLEKKAKRKRPFSSLGFQSGEIAKYGLLYEGGGRRFMGFHMAIRTSLTPDEDILNGVVTANKTEIDLGPNFKISRHIYFNLGAGYGMYSFVDRNDYSGRSEVSKAGYLVTSAGLMIRLSKIININGGASFMDIDKGFYKPEIIFGLSFNLKGK